MKKRIFTKKPMKFSSFRLPVKTVELVRSAAALEGVSQSQFLRLSLEERVTRVIQEQRRAVS